MRERYALRLGLVLLCLFFAWVVFQANARPDARSVGFLDGNAKTWQAVVPDSEGVPVSAGRDRPDPQKGASTHGETGRTAPGVETGAPDGVLTSRASDGSVSLAIPDTISVGFGNESLVKSALVTVGDRLVELWNQVALQDQEAAGISNDSPDPGVLAGVALWDQSARVRTTYQMQRVDLDDLRALLGEYRTDDVERVIGVQSELNLRDVGSVKIGYSLHANPQVGDEPYVRVADAEIAYHIGERTTVEADARWTLGSSSEHTAGLSVSYKIAPNTSLTAGYRLLNFGDVDGASERHHATAGIQLRF